MHLMGTKALVLARDAPAGGCHIPLDEPQRFVIAIQQVIAAMTT
jgi:hypothetical protein